MTCAEGLHFSAFHIDEVFMVCSQQGEQCQISIMIVRLEGRCADWQQFKTSLIRLDFDQ